MKTSVGISILLLFSAITWQAGAQQTNFTPLYDIDTYMDAGISQVISSPIPDELFFGNPNPYIAYAFVGAEMVVDISYNDKWLRVGVTNVIDSEPNDELKLSADSYLFYDAAVEYYEDECVCLIDNIVAEIHFSENEYHEYYTIAMPLSMLSDEFVPFLRNRIAQKRDSLDAVMSIKTEGMNKYELKRHNREVRDALEDIERLLYAYDTAESMIVKANHAIEQRLMRLVSAFSKNEVD